MGGAPEPVDERERLEHLRALEVLDTPPEAAFDDLVKLVAERLGTPIATFSLIDEQRQWFKAVTGMDVRESPRQHAFCAWAILGDDVLVVPDATQDDRFADNPFVASDPGVRFYAGAPVTVDGIPVGTVCAVDHSPRTLSDSERRFLRRIARLAREILVTRRAALVMSRRARVYEMTGALVNVGHWRLDLRARSVFWTDEVYRIHGRDPRTYVPSLEAGIEAYHPEDRRRVVKRVREALANGQPFDVEARLLTASGELRVVRSFGHPEIDPGSGAVVGMVGMLHDVTEQRRMLEHLAHVEKMASAGALAASVAHEINNPLSYIKVNAQALAEDLSVPRMDDEGERPDLRSLADEITEGARRIQHIVGGLRAFARPSQREVGRVDLAQVVDVAARLCTTELRHRATVELQLTELPLRTIADESQLVQVLVNLLVNAGHAVGRLEDGAHVVVRTGGEDDRVFFEVEDNGSGMSAETQREVFTPFFTTKPTGVGTGLGLAICRGIVVAHQGTIEVDSEPGRGTRMRVWLPAAPARTSLPPEPPSARSAMSALPRRRVLIVDDDAPVGRSLARVLRHHEVTVVTDPREALDRLEDHGYDVVLCDLMMPGMTGAEFHDALVAVSPELAARMVVVTGGAFTPDARAFLESMEERTITKPVDAELLRAKVEAIAALQRSSQPSVELP